MNVKGLFYIIVLLVLHLFVVSVSSANLSDEWLYKEYQKKKMYSYVKYLDDKKKEWHLEHKSYSDLLDTTLIVKEEFKDDPVFKFEDAMSIVMKESKFNQYAVNKNDGGKGLGQITGIESWWKKELAFMTDPFNKKQNIKAIRVCLNSFYKQYGSKYQAIKHYNGSTIKSDKYAKDVINMSKRLKLVS